jgi:lipopolysaccharide/colanic/teichoic acid biosynthesis glycosyltransferase
VKRAFDIMTSLVGLVLLGPIMVLGMIAVKLTSKGPVFYRQTRLGRFGKSFEVLKLRSMVVDAERDGAQWSAAGNDPRSTRVGRVLRRYRIDEIPQLINVFRGEMSFVGPRPERPEFFKKLVREIPYFQERLLVQPGLTGWAQVNYPYGSTTDDARRKLEYDLYYMKHMSVFLDVFILLDTFSIIVRGGLDESKKVEHPVSRAIMDHYRAIPAQHVELSEVSDTVTN